MIADAELFNPFVQSLLTPAVAPGDVPQAWLLSPKEEPYVLEQGYALSYEEKAEANWARHLARSCAHISARPVVKREIVRKTEPYFLFHDGLIPVSVQAPWEQPARRWDLEIEARFARLAASWREETMFTSSSSEKVLNENYLQIIGMGREVLPLILRSLRESPEFWFPALAAVTGANPVEEKDRGDFVAMAKAWVLWGEELGYC